MNEKKNVYVKVKIEKEIFPIPKETRWGKLDCIIKDPTEKKKGNYIVCWMAKDGITGFSFSKKELRKLEQKKMNRTYVKPYVVSTSYLDRGMKWGHYMHAPFSHIEVADEYRQKGIWPVVGQRQLKDLKKRGFTFMSLPTIWGKRQKRTQWAIGEKIAEKNKSVIRIDELQKFLKKRKKISGVVFPKARKRRVGGKK